MRLGTALAPAAAPALLLFAILSIDAARGVEEETSVEDPVSITLHSSSSAEEVMALPVLQVEEPVVLVPKVPLLLCPCLYAEEHQYEGIDGVCDPSSPYAQRECPKVYDNVCPPTELDASVGLCTKETESMASCEYGTERCCGGREFVSMRCDCSDNHFGCHNTEACMMPELRCPELYTHECMCPYPDDAGNLVTYKVTLDVVGVWEPDCSLVPLEIHLQSCPDKPLPQQPSQPVVAPIACPADAMICPDGSPRSRDPNNNCRFPPCPAGCMDDVLVCPDNITTMTRDPTNKCEFPPCPDPLPCTKDLFECPDGTYVKRDYKNDCEFFPCPKTPAEPVNVGGPEEETTTTEATEAPPKIVNDEPGLNDRKGPKGKGKDKPGKGPKVRTAPTGGPATTPLALPTEASPGQVATGGPATTLPPIPPCSDTPQGRAYSLCDKYCNEDNCPEALAASSDNGKRQRRLRRRRGLKPKRGKDDRGDEKKLEHCIELGKRYEQVTGAPLGDCGTR